MLDKSYQKSIHTNIQPQLYKLLGLKLENPVAPQPTAPAPESLPLSPSQDKSLHQPTETKSPPPPTHESKSRPKKEDVSLDDIANLFK